jgi:basic membrane protein A
MLKRSRGLIALLAIMALVAAACGDGSSSDGNTICQVTDVGGIDDKGFNASAWEGAQRTSDLGWDSQFLESQAETDYAVNIDSFVDEGCSLVTTIGFLLGDATLAGATANPDTPFAIVDFAYDEPPANLRGLVFNTDEAAFLAGYLAAGMTQTGTVGTFGGINIPPVTIFMDGYLAGVNYHNAQKGTSVSVIGWDGTDGAFTGNFESLDDGRAFAQNQVDEGADIVMPVAGPVGQGSAALASELGTDALKIIGVDSDAFVADSANSSVYLTSVLKRIDNAVYSSAEAVDSDTFDNSLYVGTLANGGVGLADYHDLDGEVPDDLKKEIEDIQAGIIDGSISVS